MPLAAVFERSAVCSVNPADWVNKDASAAYPPRLRARLRRLQVGGQLAVVSGGDGGKVLSPTIRIDRTVDRVGQRTMYPPSIGGTCARVDGGSNQWVSKLQGRLCAQQAPANCIEFGVFVRPEIQRCLSHKRSVSGGLCSSYKNEGLYYRR